MPLTDAQRQEIRDEEFFRNEIRQEIAGRKAPPTFIERFSTFLETKAGFWLLTSVLAGLTATGLTTLQRHLDREEIAQREIAESARRDMETVLKLGPMLTSDKRTQVDVAIILLDGLASEKALDSRVANQVKALVQSTLASGLKRDASGEEKAQAEAIIAFADRARVAAIQTPESNSVASVVSTPSAVSTAIDNSSLPIRIYLQIANGEGRSRAEAAQGALRKAGLFVPGIEEIPAKIAPRANDLRYCDGKVDENALERVKSVVATIIEPMPKMIVLDPKQCRKVRFNHFEVWFARMD